MNAGAEYVLYRIWATLQESDGIHAESLFTCLGALSGYACQVSVRQRYTLTSTLARDGTSYFHGDALNLPLTESPLSVWALVRRALQKLRAPLPEIAGIQAHVTQTVGTSAFGMPRVPERHRPRHPADVYLKHIWPQILPIAQRFCRKPGQLPVLFGIAIQRAIEHTAGRLNPTLGALIAMECAIAMSRVALAETVAEAPTEPAPSPALVPQIVPSSKPALPLPTGIRVDPARVRTSASGKKKRRAAEMEALAARSFSARLPRAKLFATAASVAIVAVVSTMWRSEHGVTPVAAPRIERKLKIAAIQNDTRPTEPQDEQANAQPVAQAVEETSAPAEETQAARQDALPAPVADPDLPTNPPQQPDNEGIISVDS